MMDVFINVIGLLFVATAVASGFGLGTWLCDEIGGLLGVAAGALSGFRLAADCGELLRQQLRNTRTLREGRVAVFSDSARSSLRGSKKLWFKGPKKGQSIFIANSSHNQRDHLREIHHALAAINARLWKELRIGAFAGCHARLYTIQLEEGGESLDWRAVNRRLLSCLRRFEKATTDGECHASLVEALDRVGQKLLIVKHLAVLKADTSAREEQEELQRTEAELWRLSRLLRSWSLRHSEPSSLDSAPQTDHP
ncbi:MAG TPA: hypothetical protein VMU60_10605 [Syntrophobacteria bacterium]|nr:hypothetical protein [Syntrophobacteria bacterium]